MDFLEFKKKYQKAEVTAFPNQVAKTPLISVLLQTYNQEDYIEQCLDAILDQQTDFDIEILLGEDDSTDKTREICLKYAEKFPDRIRLFLHQPANKIKVLNIPTGNFNAINNLYQAKGEYIAFCEGDDYWTDQHKLQKQVDFLKAKPDFVLSYHQFEEKYETQSGKENRISLEQPAKELTKEELSRLVYHPLLSTVCFRNCLRDLPEEMIQVINVDSFILSMLGTFGKAKFQPEIRASVYRRHSGGIWTKKNREIQLRTKILLFKNLVSYYNNKDKSLTRSFQKDLKNTNKMLFALYLKDFKPFKAAKLLPALL
ncbi:glycosyltransferase family 2 protein [Salegentibacter flavus]|uniref:Glycosyltransferase involved in cell wall bisynthesis n=1 Tax=Salegentibacter flavus TaxID=287099 RepID=A0A1I5BGN5_9FLAO|nr:glycosyltransferase [Salegentibacter flavus]SFN73893.1 Glycosyltransferase involved in cell wall bisynthesis [Salegentibacter flavus]